METLSVHSPWFPIVSVDPEKLGRDPVFRGTRVPVRALFDYLKDGYDIPTFLDHFPGVAATHVRGVLDLSAGGVAHESRAA